MTGLANLKKETAIKGMREISLAAQGEKPWPLFYDELKNLSGDDLKKEIQELDEKAVTTPQDFALRMNLMYAYALHRDSQYGLATGRHLYALGVHNALRGRYEAARHLIDATAK